MHVLAEAGKNIKNAAAETNDKSPAMAVSKQ
jgi:hypothetical protein